MTRWKISFGALAAAVIFAAVALAQTSSGIMTQECRRVAGRLACLCGCKQTVAECQMLECGYSSPLRQKIMAQQRQGKDDDSIVNAIVTERGNEALAAPPTQGFNLLAWWMPFVALVFGLGAVYLALRRFLRPAVATTTPAADAKLLERYHDQIEKDLEKLD
ncbi:MAG TPA: cytochrome c-type biogenesis protein CcmH [Bryobacteraceae bacterium]|nr:cytochrome c-type biogenesis protein CcmH [Bryobacteraceae bacterium]